MTVFPIRFTVPVRMQIQLRNISKQYGAVAANRNISITFSAGSIHGILGENGAGKSTLMKVLSGYAPSSSGDILINGRPVCLHPPLHALRNGIGMLYQEPMDISRLTVLDNYTIGNPGHGWFNKRVLRKQLMDSAEKFGFDLPPEQPLGLLTLGERQQLDLIRLLSLGVGTLILDEPTTGISKRQKEILFSALRKLADEGKTILLVSHKIKDVLTLCDHVAVLRKGSLAAQMNPPFSESLLLKHMFGEEPNRRIPSGKTYSGGLPVLTMDRVAVSFGRSSLKSCNTILRESEIVGLAGLDGSGQEAYLRLAAGLIRAAEGELHFHGQKIKNYRYHQLRKQGIFFMSSDRLEEGLIAGITIAEHMALIQPHKKFILPWEKIRYQTESKISEFDIRGRPNSLVQQLSGGNQQRLLLSFIPPQPRLLLLENPTRGLDLDSSADIWNRLIKLCQQRTCIIFSSPDLEELFTYASRLLVFFNGRIVQDVTKEHTDLQRLSLAISGAA